MFLRLLFVDDEAMILDGLRRALHGMRREWDMYFVDNADAALHALEHDPLERVGACLRLLRGATTTVGETAAEVHSRSADGRGSATALSRRDPRLSDHR